MIDPCFEIAQFALPRLIKFRKTTQSYPDSFTYEDWLLTIDDMIYALTIEYCQGIEFMPDADYGRKKKGMELFGKYFSDLWS